jgi:hypothetical protein
VPCGAVLVDHPSPEEIARVKTLMKESAIES